MTGIGPGVPAGGTATDRPFSWRSLTRWWPLVAATTAVVLTVGLFPPPSSTTPAGTGYRSPGYRSGSGCPTDAGGCTSSGTVSGTGAPLSNGNVETAAGGALGGSPDSSSALSPGAPGVTDSGTRCGPGVRQVGWTQYAPWCVPAFSGNNGGATSHGVTSSTITLTYRVPNSAQQQLVTSFPGANLPNQQYLADMNTYISYFNSQFELYGRHVVLKPFNAQGDYLAEDTGSDTGGAQADAATSSDLGAFGDVTFPLFGSVYYWQDLAAEHVVSIGALALPQSWYAQYAPYEWAVTPTSDELAQSVGQVVCRRMAGMPAIFAGESDFQHATRKFGLITPDQPVYLQAAGFMENDVRAGCGMSMAKVASYSENPADYTQEAVNIMAQMKAAGVTTIICGCDPVFPIELTRAADQQSYYPEWMAGDYDDPITRDYSSDQFAHAIGYPGGQSPVPSSTQAYKVFEVASHGQPPAEQFFETIYYTLLFVYSGLQAAGPDLTPASFQRGMFSLPSSSPGGEAGQWTYGNGIFTPLASYALAWWNPNATSNFDGGKGAWLNCNGGAQYPYTDGAPLGGPGVQLHCFGN